MWYQLDCRRDRYWKRGVRSGYTETCGVDDVCIAKNEYPAESGEEGEDRLMLTLVLTIDNTPQRFGCFISCGCDGTPAGRQ